MLPFIDKQNQVTNYLKSHPQQLKPKQRKKPKQWSQQYQLISITTPQYLQNAKYKKQFKLKMFYKHLPTQKKHCQSITFGSQKDFIFTKDQNQRLKTILKLKQIDNPLSPDYWRAHLCNKCETIEQAVNQFNQFLLKRKQFIKK